MTDYKEKYIKYKSKYLALKDKHEKIQEGGKLLQNNLLNKNSKLLYISNKSSKIIYHKVPNLSPLN